VTASLRLVLGRLHHQRRGDGEREQVHRHEHRLRRQEVGAPLGAEQPDDQHRQERRGQLVEDLAGVVTGHVPGQHPAPGGLLVGRGLADVAGQDPAEHQQVHRHQQGQHRQRPRGEHPVGQ
jgi:hypothetical protein